jgi:biopolymer transport protein ExbB
MLELVQAGGWLMIPIIGCSVVAAAICVERMWTLQPSRVVPKNLTAQVWAMVKHSDVDPQKLNELRNQSPLGQIFAAGLVTARRGRLVMKESMEEAANAVVHELERYLTPLGTIATASPLLGLLGTVVGMIQMFSALFIEGTGNANALSGGIAKALVTTAAGLFVAIPSLMFYRFFLRRVDDLVVMLEQEAGKLVNVVHGERDAERS